MAGGVGSFVSNVASTTLGVGLGSSLLGLPLTALNRYLQLSQVLTQIDRKFRDSGDSAQWFGRQMGFGIARSGQLAETLGKVTNRIDQESAVGMAGFARFTGADPGLALGTLGRMGTLSGRPTSDIDMARVLVGAKAQGMDQGRLEEFLTRVETSIQTAFEATGRVSLQATMATVGLPSVVYGENDPRRANDTSLVSGLNSTMTGGGAMRSYMMRAMGYGQSGGPSYIAMKKRLDAGVFDPQNVLDLFGSFQARGMGEGAQFRALESVAGGSLKAHQIEALVIDETTHMGHLKWVLEEFCKAFFEVDDVKMRFRASHFPFTEPSMEVDIDAAAIGKPGRWLEILGSGMVHPNVIRNCGLDPDKYQGFAFGMGLDRITMLKYGIPDLRDMFSADLRWMKHYGFLPLDMPSISGGAAG